MTAAALALALAASACQSRPEPYVPAVKPAAPAYPLSAEDRLCLEETTCALSDEYYNALGENCRIFVRADDGRKATYCRKADYAPAETEAGDAFAGYRKIRNLND